MRYLLFASLGVALAAAAHAQDGTCRGFASEKKLAGAALSSFMKKCEGNAKNACLSSASARKLSGAAKTSFTTRCMRDKVGG